MGLTGGHAAGDGSGKVGRVVDALDGDVVGAEALFELGGKGGANGRAHVAGLGGAAGEDVCEGERRLAVVNERKEELAFRESWI